MPAPRLALFLGAARSGVGARGSVPGGAHGSTSDASHLLPIVAEGRRRWPTHPGAAVRFEGLELTLDELGSDRIARREAASAVYAAGSALNLRLSTAPPPQHHPRHRSSSSSSSSSWMPSTPAEHLETLESELAEAEALGEPLAHLTLRGGSDAWTEEGSSEYLKSALPMLSSFLGRNSQVGRHEREVDTHGSRPAHLTGVSHEVCRGTSFFHPHTTIRALERFPPLRLSAQLRDWSLVCGRVIGAAAGAEETLELHQSVGFHVDHLRALSSTDRRKDEHENEVQFWRACWDHKQARAAVNVLATAEDMAEAVRVQAAFEAWRGCGNSQAGI